MKMTPKRKIILGSVLGVVAVAITITALCVGLNKTIPTENPDNTSKSPTDVVVSVPTTPDITDVSTEQPSNKQIIIDVGNGSQPSDNTSSKTPAKDTDKTVSTFTPTQPNNNGGVNIGGSEPTAYNCNTANHHCDGPETHAYITNLELQGCMLCGSHSCASFYALDEWGHTCYNVTKCPKYDAKKDPVLYCQICGKTNGDGSNGTCVQFVNDANCPNCGQFVKANTCHTCP